MKKNSKKEKKKEKLKQRKLEMKIIEHRAIFQEEFLKKNEKGEKLWIKWKDVELRGSILEKEIPKQL